MKNFLTLFLTLSIFSFSFGQSTAKQIAINICDQLDSIDDLTTLEDTVSKLLVYEIVSKTEQDFPLGDVMPVSVEDMKILSDSVYNLLPSYCYNVRRLIIEHKESLYYKLSDNEEANIHFDQGNKFLDKRDFKNAAKEFKKAIKIDSKFVYAIDHLAISYRFQNKYKAAEKYYKKSLKIFPEGNLALLNLGVIYGFMGNNQKALENYQQLVFLYPDNPEGYFGSANALFIMENYEDALENAFVAHLIYLKTESDYVNDSQGLIIKIISKLKDMGKSDFVLEKAKEYNIQLVI